MKFLAYGVVVLVWGTTPLAIQWSGQSGSPFVGAAGRVSIAFVVLLICLRVFKIKLPFNRDALKMYCMAVPGHSVALLLTYWALIYIESGLVSVLYGLTPLATGLLTWFLCKEVLTTKQYIAVLLALFGLFLVFSNSMAPVDGSVFSYQERLLAISAVILAMVLYSVSSVGIKILDTQQDLHPLAMTTGGIAVSLPLFLLAMFYFEPNILAWDMSQVSVGEAEVKSILATVYLAIFASVFAPVSYFYALKRMSANSMSLTTVMTPVIALMLGSFLNDENLSYTMMLGVVVILLSLIAYIFGGRKLVSTLTLRSIEVEESIESDGLAVEKV